MSKDKIIVLGHPIYDIKTKKKHDWEVSSMRFDFFKNTIKFSLEKGQKIKQFEITFDLAEEIKFINCNALNKILDK